MVRKESCKGYEQFRETIDNLAKEENNKIYVYFIGEKDDKGTSWCPDCNEAEPIVTKAMNEYSKEKDVILIVDVGNRKDWKDETNSFRHDKDVKLMEIPTILLWKSVLRLNGDQCKNMDLLNMFFKEEDI